METFWKKAYISGASAKATASFKQYKKEEIIDNYNFKFGSIFGGAECDLILKDTLIDIIVKGDGEYRYTNADGVSKVVVKAIWQNNEVYNDSSTKQIDEKIENSIIKKQYNENGILLEIEYPAKIIPNSYVDFKITVINNLPYIDTKGGITIGFPQYKSLDIIKNNSTLVTKSYPSKSKLWNGNIKQTISSEYFMIEGWETDWKQSQIKTMNFSVFINDSSELKNINIFVRSILISNKIEYVNPIDGIEGQQGYKNVNISIPLIRDWLVLIKLRKR